MKAYVLLQGRLGNQLFQIAYAHKLRELFDEVLLIDLDDSRNKLKSTLAQSRESSALVENLVLACTHNVSLIKRDISSIQTKVLLNPRSRFFLGRLIHSYFIDTNEWSKKDMLEFNKESRFKLFQGFYQSTELLGRHLQTVVKELKSSLVWSSVHRQSTGTSIHVRRGDYKNNTNPETFGILSDEYFLRIISEFGIEKFDLFVQDTNDVKKLINNLKPQNVFNSENSSLLSTFVTMSSSKQLVMSNSTFSWWAGLLVLNNGGKVFFPEPFFRSAELNERVSIYLPGMIKVPSAFPQMPIVTD
jgi:hypothetical protein